MTARRKIDHNPLTQANLQPQSQVKPTFKMSDRHRDLKEGVYKPRSINNNDLSGFYEDTLPTANSIPTKTFMPGIKIQHYLLQLQKKIVGSKVIELLIHDPNTLSSSPTNCYYESPVRAVKNKGKLWQNFPAAHDLNNCMTGRCWKGTINNNELTWRGRISTEFHVLGGVPDPSGSGAAPMHV